MLLSNDFINSCQEKYNVILADPPWSYNNRARGCAASEYEVMTIDDIKNLNIQHFADKNCALFLWSTFPLLQEGLDVMKSWGFTYKSAISWHKKTKNGKDCFGPGFWLRGASELILFGIKGKPILKNHKTRNILEAVSLGHSRKPKEQYNIIESMFDGPYLELFGREKRDGWKVYGNETETFDPQNRHRVWKEYIENKQKFEEN